MGEPPSSSEPGGRNEIDVLVEDPAWTATLGQAERLVARAVESVLATEARRDPQAAGDALELSVLLTDDDAVRALNARYRGKDKPTNVLSFPADLEPLPGEHRLLGDIALAFETCRREAEEQGKPLGDHLTHLVIHGTLHLLGFDHETDAEAELMEGRERALMASLGLPDPYAEMASRREEGRGQAGPAPTPRKPAATEKER